MQLISRINKTCHLINRGYNRHRKYLQQHIANTKVSQQIFLSIFPRYHRFFLLKGVIQPFRIHMYTKVPTKDFLTRNQNMCEKGFFLLQI